MGLPNAPSNEPRKSNSKARDFKVLALGFAPILSQVGSDIPVADLFSSDSVKGFDLLLIECRHAFGYSDDFVIPMWEHNAYGALLDGRTNQIIDQAKRGASLAVFPADGHESWRSERGTSPFQMQSMLDAWERFLFGLTLRREKGRQLMPLHPAFAKFLQTLEEEDLELEYRHSLKLPETAVPGIGIPNNDDVVGGAMRMGDGIVMFLPDLHAPTPEHFGDFVDTIWSLGQSLRKSLPRPEVKEALPEWAKAYVLPHEAEFRQEIEQTKAAIEGLVAKRDDLHANLTQREECKRLFTAQGQELEDAVEATMMFFGFKPDPQENKNRTDRIFHIDDKAVVMEIKGRDNRGAEGNHIGQTVRWKGEFYAQHGHPPTASILVVNGFRTLPLSERVDKRVFEVNLDADARQAGVGLISGLQLLGLRVAVEKEEITQEEARDRLLNCCGLFEGYDEILSVVAANDKSDASD